MIYSLNGILTHVEPNLAVIECGGVGYSCSVSMNTQGKLPDVGNKVKLITHMIVREDCAALYGFFTNDELSCFKMLTGVSGVGAKVALAILSTHSAEQVAISVASGDVKTLTQAAGVGKKLAERIILELKDKVLKMPKSAPGIEPANALTGQVNMATKVGQAINALTVLGYSPSEVVPVITKFSSDLQVEELIKLTLKSFGGDS